MPGFCAHPRRRAGTPMQTRELNPSAFAARPVPTQFSREGSRRFAAAQAIVGARPLFPESKPMASKSNPAQISELLLQALETERGGIQVYERAIQAAVNPDLKK